MDSVCHMTLNETLDSLPIEKKLEYMRNCSAKDISSLVTAVIPLDHLPLQYLESLSTGDRTICYRAAMICWVATGSTIVPREMQFRAVLSDFKKKDSLIAAGTGSGKTLPIALCILLDDPVLNPLTITASPLKRRQVSQEADFNSRFGIRTVTINEDTPRDIEWWNENVHNATTHKAGTARHIIVTVEQLFKSSAGHFARLGFLIRKCKEFQRRIKWVNVDEAHCIHMAGLPLYGSNAFRPAWGMLDELKALLPSDVIWNAFSATFPPHILKTVTRKVLKPDYVTIHVTSNRPNTMYATHQVHGSIDDPRNYTCFIQQPFDLDKQPHVLIFFDDKDLTKKVAQHLDDQLPAQHRGRGIVRHYHSGMSEEYLKRVHNSFVGEAGQCRILVATSGESVGVDFPNVKIVCTAGLPSTIVDALQRGGRALRVSEESALFVVFYEAWALTIDEKEYTGDILDPDRPRKDLRVSSRRTERAPLSGIRLVQSKTCLRRFYAIYLNDTSPEALDFITPFCCDRCVCEGKSFRLEDYLPGYLFQDAIPAVPSEPRAANRYRPTWEWHELDLRLIAWVEHEHSQDLCSAFRAPYDILSQAQRDTLVRTQFSAITSASIVTKILDESEEWGEEWAEKIYKVICDYQTVRPPKPRKV